MVAVRGQVDGREHSRPLETMGEMNAVRRPLQLGAAEVDPPVVLAPMAGITNSAFRRLCREYGAGLYVSEMITSRALVERDDETMRMVTFAPEESQPGMVRSIQLYGVDPAVVGEAVRIVVAEDRADHVDLNFGCPVPKVTRKGGGSALPYKRGLLRDILRAAVRAADGRVPITMKMRKGIDDDTLTYLDAGRIAEDEGCAWVALHGRTAAQMYGGQADWSAIARLKEHVSVPVLGNGDIWEAADALRMVAETGCDGVVVGRGCLGRPWLFGELAAAFAGRPAPPRPGLAEVARVMRRHAELLCELYGEDKGSREIRKHVAWYTKGFAVGSELRQRLAMVSSLAQLDDLLGTLDLDQPYPEAVLGLPRGRTTGQKRVALPAGWLDDVDDASVPVGAEIGISGG
jgi:nifR3 family TIM-barrel protein